MAERKLHKDFPVGKGLPEETVDELTAYREPEAIQLPLGTIFTEDGQRRVVGTVNHEGYVTAAYHFFETRRGKLVIDPRSGGSPNRFDIKDMEKRTMKRKKFIAAFKRGNQKNIKDKFYKKKLGKKLVEIIKKEWKPQSSRRGKK